MSTKQLRETRKIELVETHNIAMSLVRLNPHILEGNDWKRALYHAVAMSGVAKTETLTHLREALKLP